MYIQRHNNYGLEQHLLQCHTYTPSIKQVVPSLRAPPWSSKVDE